LILEEDVAERPSHEKIGDLHTNSSSAPVGVCDENRDPCNNFPPLIPLLQHNVVNGGITALAEMGALNVTEWSSKHLAISPQKSHSIDHKGIQPMGDAAVDCGDNTHGVDDCKLPRNTSIVNSVTQGEACQASESENQTLLRVATLCITFTGLTN
jgi:hypothetical protein